MTVRKALSGLIDKRYYRQLSKDGFEWGGYWDGMHRFQREVRTRYVKISDTESRVVEHHYECISCTDEDIENGNFNWFVKNGYTRTAA